MACNMMWSSLASTQFNHRARAAVSAAFAALIMVGCNQNVDLSALVALGKSTMDAQSSFASLSDDFYESCVRTVGWQRASSPDSFPNVFSSCSENATAAKQWQAANSTVTAYVASLANLAGGNNTSTDYGLGDFAKTLSGLGITKAFNEAQSKAAVGAATSLVNDYFNFRRREDLAAIMPSADQSLDEMIATLEDVARTNYLDQLGSERNALQTFFEPNISAAKPGLERLYALQFRKTEHDEQATLDGRQAAVAHYVSALEQIKSVHHKIVDAVTSNNFSDVNRIVSGYLAEYQPQLAALKKAFP